VAGLIDEDDERVIRWDEKALFDGATLPSALFEDRYFGASWVFSLQPVLPPDYRPWFHLPGWKLGQTIDAVTRTRGES
jgi:hypothetical protein